MNAYLGIVFLSFTVASSSTIGCDVNGTYLPNPDDCSSFYQCSNGIPQLLNCPTGLYFNPVLNVCDYPGNVNCKVQTTEAPAYPECPSTGFQRFPNHLDCASYYLCVRGIPNIIKCEADLVYDPEEQNCNSLALCNIRSTTSLPTSTSTSTSAPLTYPECPGPLYYHYPNPEDCQSYFFCYKRNGRPASLLTCSGDWNYDYNSEQCKPNGKCFVNGEKTSEEPSYPECPSTGFQRFPNPLDCGSYYLCYNGISNIVKCDNNQAYDPVQQNCDSKAECTMRSTALPPEEISIVCPGPGIYRYPNPDDCQSYFFCSSYQASLIRCRPGMNYDYDQEMCRETDKCFVNGKIQ